MSEHRQDEARGAERRCEDDCPECSVELIHVSELEPRCDEIVSETHRIGELLCFARNRHCSLGYSGCLPELRDQQGMLFGSSAEATLTLDTDNWRSAFTTQEHSTRHGTMLGLEYFDENRCAIFRTALTPDSERFALQEITHAYHRRCAPPESFAAWRRMAELPTAHEAQHAAASEHLLGLDRWSAPLGVWARSPITREMGFIATEIPLAFAVFTDAIEDGQPLVVTISGAFGRMSLPFTPQVMERIQRGWLFIGGEGRVMRLNAGGVASYWLGCIGEGNTRFSYLEGLDVFGDLVFRITSDNPQSFQYWQALARNMS